MLGPFTQDAVMFSACYFYVAGLYNHLADALCLVFFRHSIILQYTLEGPSSPEMLSHQVNAQCQSTSASSSLIAIVPEGCLTMHSSPSPFTQAEMLNPL